MAAFDTISFLSDYGTDDEFVGVVKSVIRSISPATVVIDVTHAVEPHDVRAGGLTLARSVQYLAPGVVLAVVDPGVGTDRLPIMIEVADGAAYLIGPDNGLLAPAVSLVGGATAAFVLDKTDFHLPAPGPTFHGRDIFAPVAAHLCNGVAPNELGSPIDPSRLLPGLMPVSQVGEDGSISAEVLWVDRYGNAQLNVDPLDLAGWPEHVVVVGGRQERTALRVTTYSQVPTGSIGLLVDSYGLLSLAVDRGSAAFELELAPGLGITLRPAEGVRANPVAVTLGTKPTVGERPVESEDCP